MEKDAELKRSKNVNEGANVRKLRQILGIKQSAFAEKYIIACGNVQAIFHCFALFTAVEQLKEKEKTVVVLKYWGGYTDKYIAQYLSVTERTVRNLKSRAYIALKILLEKEDVMDDADL